LEICKDNLFWGSPPSLPPSLSQSPYFSFKLKKAASTGTWRDPRVLALDIVQAVGLTEQDILLPVLEAASHKKLSSNWGRRGGGDPGASQWGWLIIRK
jgi:hypothetical protein